MPTGDAGDWDTGSAWGGPGLIRRIFDPIQAERLGARRLAHEKIRGDEAAEERVRGVGLAEEFRMRLAGDVERMVPQLDHLNELPVG